MATRDGAAPGRAVIAVADEGVGIAAAELPNVFEMFSQVDTTIDRSRGGLGMGLTLVKRIVEMHGGTVEAASDGPGRGTRFTLRLPLVETGAAPASPRGTRTTAAGPGRRPPGGPRRRRAPRAPRATARSGDATPIRPRSPPRRPRVPDRRLMLVDDNLETVAALERLFVMKGYEVRTAHDGTRPPSRWPRRSSRTWRCSTSGCPGPAATRWPPPCARAGGSVRCC